MLRILILIIAGLGLSVHALAASASTYHYVNEEAVLQDVTVTSINGGINPELSGYRVQGQVKLGTNSCSEQTLKATLAVEKVGQDKQYFVARLQGSQRSGRICIELDQTATVVAEVRGKGNLAENIFIRNVEEMGKVESLSAFRDHSSACDNIPTVCTREYMPTVCELNGKSFSGSNRCEALVAVQRFACENGIAYNLDDVSCRSEDSVPLFYR